MTAATRGYLRSRSLVWRPRPPRGRAAHTPGPASPGVPAHYACAFDLVQRAWPGPACPAGGRRYTVTVYDLAQRAWCELRPPKGQVRAARAAVDTSITEAELRSRTDLRVGDVLEVFAGPYRGTWWSVTAAPRRLSNDALQAELQRCRELRGSGPVHRFKTARQPSTDVTTVNATDSIVSTAPAIPTPPAAAQAIGWPRVIGLVAAGVAAAFGAGAGAGVAAGGEPHPTAQVVDSLVERSLTRVRVGERLERLESEAVITGCVARQQIKQLPIEGCAYLLERQSDKP